MNAKGVFLCCKHEIAAMRRTAPGAGRIVNIASLAGKVGIPLQAHYSALKFADPVGRLLAAQAPVHAARPDAHHRRRRGDRRTMGAPASFGAFTPGVAHDHTASTTATVTSTAGDATLSVSTTNP